MELKHVLAKNVNMIARAEGYSSNSLAKKVGMPQKTIWNIMEAHHDCRLESLAALAHGLGTSPLLLLSEGLTYAAFKSLKSTRMMSEYLSLPAIQRARVDAMVKGFKPVAAEPPMPAELQAVMGF